MKKVVQLKQDISGVKRILDSYIKTEIGHRLVTIKIKRDAQKQVVLELVISDQIRQAYKVTINIPKEQISIRKDEPLCSFYKNLVALVHIKYRGMMDAQGMGNVFYFSSKLEKEFARSISTFHNKRP